jgi:type I restriction enzyme S subunit
MSDSVDERHELGLHSKSPDGWTPLRLGDVATFKNGLNFTSADDGEAIKIVGVTDFQHHTQLASTEGLATIRVSRKVRDEELLASGDLLFVRSNGNKALVGRCLYFPIVSERLAFSGFTIRGRVNRQVLLPEFAACLMRSEAARRQMALAGGGTNISNLSQDALSRILIHVPPLAEQFHIVQVLGTWDRAIGIAERQAALLRREKDGLMADLLSGQRPVRTDDGSGSA